MGTLNYKIPLIGCLKDSNDYYVMKLDSVTSVTKRHQSDVSSWLIHAPNTLIKLAGMAYVEYNNPLNLQVFYLLTTENKYRITGYVTESTHDRINILLEKPIEIIY